jgi:hypothetical protein
MKSIGGTDDITNLVLLTPKEHFIVHYLLWKIHPNDKRYRDPIFFFKKKGANNSRLYNEARVSHCIEMRVNNPSSYLCEESLLSKSKKLSDYAKKRPIEHNKKISDASKGKQRRLGAILLNESKTKISSSLKTYFKENEVSKETRKKLSTASTGRKHSKETLDTLKHKAKNRIKKPCPNCGNTYDPGNYVLHTKKCKPEK